MNVTGVIWCAMYIGHLHRTQFMQEPSEQTQTVSPQKDTKSPTIYSDTIGETATLHMESQSEDDYETSTTAIKSPHARNNDNDTSQNEMKPESTRQSRTSNENSHMEELSKSLI